MYQQTRRTLAPWKPNRAPGHFPTFLPLSLGIAFHLMLFAPPGPAEAGMGEAGSAPETQSVQEDRSFGFGQDPHVHGDRIIFSLRGNLWAVGIDGGDPEQLTRHEARDTAPRFSPNGQWIAFTSNRMGNADVWIMPAEGGEPRPLTHHSGGDHMVTWMPDSERVVFRSGRGSLQWHNQLYSVSVEGDLPTRLSLGAAINGTFSEDGSLLAFNRNRTSPPKRNYRGSTAGSVWLADFEGTDDGDHAPAFHQLTNTDLEASQSHANDALPMIGADGWIYFKSERDGIYNLWRVSPDGEEPEQVTFHERGGVQFPSISTDGQTIAYSNDFDLWLYEIGSGESRTVSMDLGWTVGENQVEFVSISGGADHFAPSPDGDYLVVDHRGEIFEVPSLEGIGEITRVTESAWRQNNALYSADGERLAYMSDQTGQEEVWIYEVATGEHHRLTDQDTRKSIEMWSPNGDWILFIVETTLYRVGTADGEIEEVASHQAGSPTPTWVSDDGEWIVAHRPDDIGNVEVFLLNASTGEEYNVTDHPARDWDGVITPDGERLLFLSNRDAGTAQIFTVALEPPVEDPRDPRVRERLRQEEKQEEDPEDGASAQLGEPDLTDIRRRARQLTEGEESISTFFLSSNGSTIYYVRDSEEEREVRAIDADGSNDRRIAEGAFQDVKPTRDAHTVFYRADDAIHRLALESGEAEPVSFEISFVVDKTEEWRQMFDELYRHWEHSYVEEDMFGLDWDSVRARYEPMVERIGETEDFYRLGLEMLHEVPSSHSGIRSPASSGPEGGNQTRFLGFEMEPMDDDLRITHLYRDGPADQTWLDVSEGDFVLAIDGISLDPTDNYWKILNSRVNEYVTVTVADSPDGANARDLRIRTVTSLSNIAYEDWVERNREFVDEATNGRIYYAHIRSMNQTYLEQFKQEMDENFHRQGLIIDVRYNGGGNIDRELMDVLQRRPYQYTWTRTDSPVVGRRPQQMIYGPQVMMHNWRSGSNAEMVPHAFSHLELGPLVGTPTAGAVVSASWLPLKDGGAVRVPRVRVVSYDPEQPNNFGVNLENYGVPPDIWVRNDPAEQLVRHDRELQEAVDEALELLSGGQWQYVDDEDGEGGDH